MMSAKLWAPALTACALATSIALVGCSKDPKGADQAAAAQQMPPTEVGVIVAQPQSVEKIVELTGRTSPYQVSEVRPQANGVVLKRLFVEGSYVQKGQPLFEIDSSVYRASLDTAKATVLRHKANLNTLNIKAKRYSQLVGINAVSKQEYDDLIGQVKLAEADVAAAEATVRNAEISLGYSTVRAPISGQSSRSTFTAGALVTASQAEPLTTIRQLDPIYVDINQSSSELLRLRQELSKGSIDRSNNTKVRLKLEDGSYYNIQGNLAFSDASVNQDTGTVTLRAVFDNPNHLLLPGMFANAEIVQGVIPNAYLVPQAALTRTPTGQATIMLVNAKGAVEVRPVETTGVKGKDWIVTKGLEVGDKIIVDGIAKVKPEQKVNAKPYQPQAAAPAAGQAPAQQPAQAAKPEEKTDAKTEQKATSNT
jgi:membrane fusion protein, multidrug efflux system